MDANVLRSVNEGPMGPQGPTKVNHAIMNQEAGFGPVVRIYDHKFPEASTDDADADADADADGDSDADADAGAGEGGDSGDGGDLDDGTATLEGGGEGVIDSGDNF